MTTITDLTKPNREPDTNGNLFCLKCGIFQPADEFRSKQGRVERFTDYCEDCRTRAREGMRLYHARKRTGVKVSRGRRSSDGILFPIRVVFTVPEQLVPVFEKFHKDQLALYFEKHKDHPDIQLALESYGVSSQAQTPKAPHLPQAPRPGAEKNTPRPRNDEEQQFLDLVSEKMADRLKNIAQMQLSGKIKSGWQQWDQLFLNWKQAGSQLGYDGPNKPLKPRRTADEPECSPSDPT